MRSGGKHTHEKEGTGRGPEAEKEAPEHHLDPIPTRPNDSCRRRPTLGSDDHGVQHFVMREGAREMDLVSADCVVHGLAVDAEYQLLAGAIAHEAGG